MTIFFVGIGFLINNLTMELNVDESIVMELSENNDLISYEIIPITNGFHFSNVNTEIYDNFSNELIKVEGYPEFTVNPQTILEESGISQGFVNVIVNDEHIVHNFYVNAEFHPSAVSVNIDRTGFLSSPISSIVYFSPSAIPYGYIPTLNPISTNILTTGNIFGGILFDLGSDTFRAAPVATLPPIKNHTQKISSNIESAALQCGPAAMANSLEFLDKTYPGISIPHNNTAGIKGDNSLVGQLDKTTGRTVIDRNLGSSIGIIEAIEGKMEYLKNNNLADKVKMKHQGPKPTQTFHDQTSTNEGNRPTAKWISKQINEGEDVTIVVGCTIGDPPTITYSHVVRVYEVGIKNGLPFVGLEDDSNQSHKPQGDTTGRNWKQFSLKDTDDDGYPNLIPSMKPKNKCQIYFAWATSPIDSIKEGTPYAIP